MTSSSHPQAETRHSLCSLLIQRGWRSSGLDDCSTARLLSASLHESHTASASFAGKPGSVRASLHLSFPVGRILPQGMTKHGYRWVSSVALIRWPLQSCRYCAVYLTQILDSSMHQWASRSLLASTVQYWSAARIKLSFDENMVHQSHLPHFKQKLMTCNVQAHI